MTLHHETLTFERRFDATPADVFAAYADPRTREVWSAPSDDVEIVIQSSDLRTGGGEIGRCGPKGAPSWTMKTAYHWVEADRLILFTEELWDAARLLTVAMVTFDIRADGDGTSLRLTDQITSFVGPDGVSGHRQGYEIALANLEGVLTRGRARTR